MQNDVDLEQPRKKALVDALGGDDPSPLGMPGVAGGAFAESGGAPPVQAAAPSAAPAPFQRNSTRLMEGDAGKLANADHAKKSPKYDFLQLANQGKYGYDQLGDMLTELQGGPNAAHWQGWSADKDKLRFGGDPSQLGDAWGGVTEVDTIGGFNSGNPQGFRWGADDQGSAAPPQGGGLFAGSSISPMLQGDASAGIQAAMQGIGGLNDNTRLQELIKQLGGQV